MATKIPSRNSAAIPHSPVKRPRGVKAPKGAPHDSVRELFLSIAARGHEIPQEERAAIPTDLARNHEHYLYGHPKQPD